MHGGLFDENLLEIRWIIFHPDESRHVEQMTEKTPGVLPFDPAVDIWPGNEQQPENIAVHQGQDQKEHEQGQFVAFVPEDLKRRGKILGKGSFYVVRHLAYPISAPRDVTTLSALRRKAPPNTVATAGNSICRMAMTEAATMDPTPAAKPMGPFRI